MNERWFSELCPHLTQIPRLGLHAEQKILTMTALLFALLFPLIHTSAVSLPPMAKLLWETEKDHDFGKIQQGRPVKFVFRYKNTGDAPLTLETVRTTCGCTAAEWTEGSVAPGASGEISVEYDAYQGGAFKKKIRVFFEEQKKAEILWIRGETGR